MSDSAATTLLRENADAVYDILRDECDANELVRPEFIAFASRDDDPREFRFIGALGFGGKFWNNSGRWYVNNYPEHETNRRNEMIQRANARLEALRRGD